MRIPALKAAAALVVLVTSCANPINLKTAERYYRAGQFESDQGNHYKSASFQSRAWFNAKVGGADPKGMSRTLYAYGRQLALLGEFDEAVERLEEALKVERSVSPPLPVEILRRTSLLGRVFLDTERPAEALPLLQESLESLRAPDGFDVRVADYMYILRDLSSATAAAGSSEDLLALRAELDELRQVHGDVEIDDLYERFTPEAVERRIRQDSSPAKYRSK